MSGYNHNCQPENRSWTHPDPRSQSFTGVTRTHPWIVPNQFEHEPQVIEEDMHEEPEQYQSPEPNMFHVQDGTSRAEQPLRSASESNAGQIAVQYGGSINAAQFQAMVEARAAEMVAQSQFYANPPTGPFLRQNTAPVLPSRQGHRYSGKLLASGNANVLVGNLMDGNHEPGETTSHDYAFTETKALKNARLIIGDTTTARWHAPNQGHIRYANGIYTTQPNDPPQSMPPQGPYQQNMHHGR